MSTLTPPPLFFWLEQLESDIVTCDQEMQKVRDTIDEYKASTQAIQEELESINTELIEAKEELESENRILNAHNEEFNDLCAIYDRKSSELIELNLRIQKLTHDNERFLKDRQNSEQTVRDLENRNEWILDEKQ
jgi:chromosome segregation ATPase